MGPHSTSTRTRKDIDLLLAIDDAPKTHLVMIEAKATSAWSSKQFISKARRLTHIFGEDGARFGGVEPHLVITSPRRPPRLSSSTNDNLAPWMKPNGSVPWLALPVPTERLVIERCGPDGVRTKLGTHWQVRQPDR